MLVLLFCKPPGIVTGRFAAPRTVLVSRWLRLRAQCKHETVLTGGCKHVNSSLRGASNLVLCPTCQMCRRKCANTFVSLPSEGSIPRKAGRRGLESSRRSSAVPSRNRLRPLAGSRNKKNRKDQLQQKRQSQRKKSLADDCWHSGTSCDQ